MAFLAILMVIALVLGVWSVRYKDWVSLILSMAMTGLIGWLMAMTGVGTL